MTSVDWKRCFVVIAFAQYMMDARVYGHFFFAQKGLRARRPMTFAFFVAPMTRLHVIFSAECTHFFDWQSVALVHSYKAFSMSNTSRITRLLACSSAQQESYIHDELYGETFIHRNLRDDPLVDEKGYPSYNKPYSAMAWLETQSTDRDAYVLMMDSDMVFRSAVDPYELGCRKGIVVSAEYSYLVGTSNSFATRFVSADTIPYLAQVGGFHIFHMEDLRRIAPMWLEYTKRVRAFAHAQPREFFNLSMRPLSPIEEPLRAVREKQAMWHSEMYGYAFAAGDARVLHSSRRDVMLYPGYDVYMGRGPRILHYGTDYRIGDLTFNKMGHTDLDLKSCPMLLFGAAKIDTSDVKTKRDAVCVQHLAIMDTAFCNFYHLRCNDRPPECLRDYAGLMKTMDAVIDKCEDEMESCAPWARDGECDVNPNFMYAHCAVSCNACRMSMNELIKKDLTAPPRMVHVVSTDVARYTVAVAAAVSILMCCMCFCCAIRKTPLTCSSPVKVKDEKSEV